MARAAGADASADGRGDRATRARILFAIDDVRCTEPDIQVGMFRIILDRVGDEVLQDARRTIEPSVRFGCRRVTYPNGRGERSGGCTSRPPSHRAAGDPVGVQEGGLRTLDSLAPHSKVVGLTWESWRRSGLLFVATMAPCP